MCSWTEALRASNPVVFVKGNSSNAVAEIDTEEFLRFAFVACLLSDN